MDVTALGEYLIDFTPAGENDGIPLYAQNPGGAPVNVLVSGSRLGLKTAFIGKVGRDGFGAFLHKVLIENKVDDRGLRFSEDIHTTLAFVQLTEGGERSFSFYRNPGADIELREDELDLALIRDSRIFHVGSLSLTDEPSRTATKKALDTAKEAGCIISYDPNYRAPLWKSEQEAVEKMLSLMPYADILKLSEEELELLTGTIDPEEGSRILYEKYQITLICVTLGAKGVFFRQGKKWGLVPGFKTKVADTNGAGDSFLGAIHYKLCGKSRDELEKMETRDLLEVMRFANAAGALATTKHGAIPAIATLEEVETFLDRQIEYR